MINNGYVDASIYVILSAVVFVFLDKLCNHIDPVTALFAMSGIALLCFNLLCLHQVKKTYLACLHHKTLFLTMSLALGTDWACMVYATHLSDPFIAMASLFTTLAIMGFIKLFFTTRSFANLLSIFLLCISLYVLKSTYEVKASQHVIYGLILGATAGIAFFIYIILSDALSKRGQLSTMQLLATRFWVLFLGSLFFLPSKPVWTVIQHNALPLLWVSFGSLIIPIYFNQQAIKKLGPARSSILISFVPPITYLFDALYNHQLILSNLMVCGIITLALVLPKLIMMKRQTSDIAIPRPEHQDKIDEPL